VPRKIEVQLSVVDQATRKIDEINGKFKRFTNSVNNSLNKAISVRNIALVAIFTGIARSSIQAASKVDQFRKQLLMVSKSAEEADEKLAAIREFGRTSPLETEDVVKSYVRLRAVGIDPTIKQLETLGGVSLLFGMKMEEGLDAFIGLNKRSLRSMGIEIDRTGSKAIIQSGNIRKETTKDAASIRQALLDVWAERFPDAITKAGQTFSARMEVMKSNIWEFQAQLVQEFMPGLEAGVNMLSGSFENMLKNIRIFKATIYAIVGGIRIIFNGLQLGVDMTIVGIMTLGSAVRVVFTGLMNLGLAMTEQIRFLGESLGATAARVVQLFAAVANRDWGGIKAAAAGIWGDIVENGTDSIDRLKNNWKAVTTEWNDAWTKMSAITELASQRSSKNFDDIADSMVAVKTAWGDINKGGVVADLGGTGSMGPAAGETDKGKKERIKSEIAILDEKLKANKAYSDLIIENVIDENDRKMVVSRQKEVEALDQAKKWLDTGIINAQRYEDMKTEIHLRGVQERSELTRKEAQSGVNFFVQASGYITSIMRSVTESTRMEAKKRQAILYAAAIIDAASASVGAIRAVIEDDSISNVYAKIAMAVVAVGAIWAAAGVQISEISSQSFAHGTAGSRRGMAMVGEQGPELMQMSPGSKVLSNYQTRNYNMTGGNVSVVIEGNADGQTVTNLYKFGRDFNEAQRRGFLRLA
jgi:small basic protein